MSDRQGFQILALDGGGLKGIFSAAILASLEEDLGTRIADHFDLIVGTSTGGLIALALGAGLRPAELVSFYENEGQAVFRDRFRFRSLRRIARPKFSAGRLRRTLEAIFGDRVLADSKTPLVIPAFDIGEDDVHLFKTPHHPRLRRDWREPMVDVALATTAAPTYFPAHQLRSSHLVDGGVWANNPAMVGVTEAVSVFEEQLGHIRVLSLGTTSGLRRPRPRLRRSGIVGWARGGSALEVVLRGQSLGAHNQVIHLLGRERSLRIDSLVPDGLVRLDRIMPGYLLSKASAISRQYSPEVASLFFSHVARPYVPHYSNEGARAHA